MSTRVTQCPKCLTSFRVTDAQLSIANGAVRCGSCLQIFNAAEHWVERRPSPPPTQAPVSTQDTSLDSIFDDDFLIHDDADIGDEKKPDNQQSGRQTPTSPLTAGKKKPANEGFNAIFSDSTGIITSETRSKSHHDHGNTEKTFSDDDFLIDDHIDDINSSDFTINDADQEAVTDDNELIFDTGTKPLIQSADEDGFFSADDLDLDEYPTSEETAFLDIDVAPRQSSVFKELDDLGDDAEDNDDSWATKLLADDDDDEYLPFERYSDLSGDKPSSSSATEPATADKDPIDDDLLDLLDQHENKQSQPHEEDEYTLGDNAEYKHTGFSEDSDEDQHDQLFYAGERIGGNPLLAGIEPEPVEFTAPRQRSRWINVGWIAAIAAAVIMLIAQYIYFDFNKLARDPDSRGWLTTLCGVAGCTLPTLDDIHQIRSNNLLVRSHPTIDNALVVDAIITNRAAFEQPYPDIELLFTDMAGNVVASRRFHPREYLSGELLGSQKMPARQPIHIALELVDPGAAAVNYEIHLHRAG